MLRLGVARLLKTFSVPPPKTIPPTKVSTPFRSRLHHWLHPTPCVPKLWRRISQRYARTIFGMPSMDALHVSTTIAPRRAKCITTTNWTVGIETIFAKFGAPGIYCPSQSHNINMGLCGNRQICGEAARRHQPAWGSRAVACRTRIYPQGGMNRFSESNGYASPEGLREQMLFNGARGN
jgi:hypothetical protein